MMCCSTGSLTERADILIWDIKKMQIILLTHGKFSVIFHIEQIERLLKPFLVYGTVAARSLQI